MVLAAGRPSRASDGPSSVRLGAVLPSGGAGVQWGQDLLTTGAKPAMLRLLPWYDGPRAAEVTAADAAAVHQITTRTTRPLPVVR